MGATYVNSSRAGMVGARVGSFAAGLCMGHVADHTNVITEGLERLQNLREFKPTAFSRGRPFIHDRPMGNIDTAETALGNGSRLTHRCLRGQHRFKQWQRESDTGALQERPPRKMLLGDKHLGSPQQRE